MTKESLVNNVWLKIQSFSQLQVYTTCYKSLVKLLLAQLTKWEKVSYNIIVTFLNKQDGFLLCRCTR